jgi:hypothetical protein
MHWSEKVQRMAKEGSLSWRGIERNAGWPLNTLKKAVRNRSMVGAGKGIGLACALNVPAEWLFDESKGWEDRPANNGGDRSAIALVRQLLKMLGDALDTVEESQQRPEGPTAKNQP